MALIITNNKDISAHNTFGMKVSCSKWISYDSVSELREAIAIVKQMGDAPRFMHIGGGSNLLFTSDYNGCILHSNISDCTTIAESNEDVLIKAGSGIVFDNLIAKICELNLWGIENLSGIPGEVGASAVQNIGAYGVEAKDVITEVECLDTINNTIVTFKNDECHYSYRDSRFKHEKNRYIVTYVTFKLSKIANPKLSYGNLSSVIAADCTNVKAIREAVIAIRNKKLPLVSEYGSVGSFFKNPIVDKTTFQRVKQLANNEDVPHYIVGEMIKIPAAWLIEQCGWKGKTLGNAGVWHLQPLVLINATGNASAQEILALEQAIISSVENKFGLTLEAEVEHI